MSVASPGSALLPDRALLNVAAYLPRMAAARPEALAVAVLGRRGPDGRARVARLTARDLDRRSDAVAHGLASAGLRPGMRTVLMVPPSPDFFALTFALFKLGAVPVLVDPGMGIANLGRCLDEARPEAFIGIPKAHAARLVLGWARRHLRHTVMVGPRIPGGGPSLRRLETSAPDTPYPVHEPQPDELAAILFTSGSTGVPKGVETPHRVFASQVQMLAEVFDIRPGERDLATFPLFALFGPALGMASIVPDMDASKPASADPDKLLEAFTRFECTNMFASPALIDKLGRHCERHGIILEGLERAISAGAPASIPAVERFARALPPGAQVFTPYGATECLPVAVIGSREILEETRHATQRGQGVCVGRPVAGMEVAIIPIHDDPIEQWSEELRRPPGEIGEIVVRGPVVTPGYFGRPEATALAKIPDPAGGLWHRMGDVGHLDEQGRLWMCGRKAHRVRTARGVSFTVPCEAVFNAHPAVFRTALVGVPRGDTCEGVLCVELEPGTPLPPKLEEELQALGQAHEHTRSIRRFLVHPGFPVDIRHNAKIFREKLAVWAQEQLR